MTATLALEQQALLAAAYQLTSRSGVAPILWIDRSAPSYSSFGRQAQANLVVTDLIRP
jgi:hypothetical protein